MRRPKVLKRRSRGQAVQITASGKVLRSSAGKTPSGVNPKTPSAAASRAARPSFIKRTNIAFKQTSRSPADFTLNFDTQLSLTHARYQFSRLPQAPHKNDSGRQRLPDAPLKTVTVMRPTPLTRPSIRLSRSPRKKRTFRYLWQIRINAAVREAV